jgi:hypothetical protein
MNVKPNMRCIHEADCLSNVSNINSLRTVHCPSINVYTEDTITYLAESSGPLQLRVDLEGEGGGLIIKLILGSLVIAVKQETELWRIFSGVWYHLTLRPFDCCLS